MNNELLEEIMQECPRKKVISLCKKLIKKCSYKSGTCTGQLCELAYWLYIYGFSQYIHRLAEETHNIPFVMNYNVWTAIFSLWGLEIRLLKENRKNDEADKLIYQINEYYLLPRKDETYEYLVQWENKRRNNELFSFPKCTYNNEIAEAPTKGTANSWKMSALMRMIGDGSTGFYPKMNEEAEKIEECIQKYISDLKEIK